jgi:hypothetical protein
VKSAGRREPGEMKCQICGSLGKKIQLLIGPGKNPEIVILCSKHKVGFKKWKKNPG